MNDSYNKTGDDFPINPQNIESVQIPETNKNEGDNLPQALYDPDTGEYIGSGTQKISAGSVTSADASTELLQAQYDPDTGGYIGTQNLFGDSDPSILDNRNSYQEYYDPNTGEYYTPYGYQGTDYQTDEDPYGYYSSDYDSNYFNDYSEYEPLDSEMHYAEEELEAEARKKKIIWISIGSAAALLLTVALFFGIRALMKSEDDENVSFKKQNAGVPSKEIRLTEPGESTLPEVTISEEGKDKNRAKHLPSNTIERSSPTQRATNATTRRNVEVNEVTTETGTQSMTQRPTTPTTRKPSPTTTRKPSPTTTRKPATTKAPAKTKAPTTTKVPAKTKAPTTTKPPTTTTKPPTTTTEPPTTTTEPVSPPSPVSVDYPPLPAAVAPNPDLPNLIRELPQNTVLSGDGKANASKIDDVSITVTNSSGTHELTELDQPVDQVIAVSEKAVFYQSGDKLYRVLISDSSVSEITDVNKYTSDTIKTDMRGNLIFWNGNSLYILKADAVEPVNISEVAYDIKIQSDLLAFSNDYNKIQYLNLSGDLDSSKVDTLSPDRTADDFAISVDGSAIVYRQGSDLFAYKDGKEYELSDSCSGFFLTDDPTIIAVLRNDSVVEVYQIGTGLNLVNTHENVDSTTFYNNQTKDYGGFYLYGIADSLAF